jgi:rRNA processing protein Gar1
LRPLGKVFNFSPSGAIVVKAGTTPRIGNIICDNKGRPIGKVVRITGPVSEPYVLVTPLAKDEMSMFRLTGKQVFIDDSNIHRPKRKGRPPSSAPRRDRKPFASKSTNPKMRRDRRTESKKPAPYKRKERR